MLRTKCKAQNVQNKLGGKKCAHIYKKLHRGNENAKNVHKMGIINTKRSTSRTGKLIKKSAKQAHTKLHKKCREDAHTFNKKSLKVPPQKARFMMLCGPLVSKKMYI